MRAPTALVSLLQGAGSASPVWRADEIVHSIATTVASGFAALDAELPGGGWPQGQLVELLLDAPGVGELSLLAPALAHVAREHRPCVWVLPCDSSAARGTSIALPYPPALADAGVEVERSIFVKPVTPRESLWALEQSLRSAHLGALIGWMPASTSPGHLQASRAAPPRRRGADRYEDYSEHRSRLGGARSSLQMTGGDFRALRRLHLLAQRHRALVFLLREARAAGTASPASLRLRLACTDGQLRVTVLKRRGWPLLEPVVLQVHPERWNDARVDIQPPVPPGKGRIVVTGTPALPARRWSLQSIFSH